MFLALDETLLSVVPMCVLAPTRSWSAVEGTLRVLGVPNLFLPEGPWAQEAGVLALDPDQGPICTKLADSSNLCNMHFANSRIAAVGLWWGGGDR